MQTEVKLMAHLFISLSDLLIDCLFKLSSRVNPEHKAKYIYLLSYAASVTETYKKVSTVFQTKYTVKHV